MDKIETLKVDQFKRIQGATLTIGNKHYPVFKGTNTIGRNRIAIINIKHLNVSQNHALIIITNETQHYVSDLNSSNGTFIQNTKLVPFKLYELTNHAEVKFGDVDGIYTKISTSNTLQLQDTIEINEFTQNMTQNFYASNTQLINNENENDHNYSCVKKTDEPSIHELPTQVVEYPSVLTEETVTEKAVVTDIHEAPTQVYNIPITNSQMNIHEAATQVLEHVTASNNENNPQEQKDDESSDPNTQILTEEEKEAIVEKINTTNEQIEAQNKKNIIHYSQEASTSGLGKSFKEFDDSFFNVSKSNDVIVEESVVENNISDDSIDFLDINTQNEIVNRKLSFSPTDSTKPAQNSSKQPVPDSTVDSEIESTQDIGFRKKPLKQLSEDSEIESTQDIGFTKKPLRPILEDSDSETDCEEVQTKTSNTGDASDSDTDIESDKKVELDDTDCIPPTQDAFAEVLGYKPTKTSQSSNANQCSEESFKLGLTELMNFTQNDDENEAAVETNDKEKEETKKFTFKKKNVCLDKSLTTILSTNNNVGKNEQEDEESSKCGESIQKINAEVVHQKKENIENEDVFLQPTQVLDSKETEFDVFQQPTQVLDSEDVFLKPRAPAIHAKLKQTESCTQDIYLAATQIIEEQPEKVSEDIPMTQEDLYGQPTQKIENISQTSIDQNEKMDVYLQPTQQITEGCTATETQLELESYVQETNQKPTETDRPVNPIIRQLNNEEVSKEEETTEEVKKNNESVETLSQIEAFLKKPLPPRKSARHIRPKDLDKQAETLSQIEDFVKNGAKGLKEDKNRSKDESKSETMSQIAAFVNQPALIKPSTCVKNSVENVSKNFSNESMEDSDTEIDKKDSSRETRSDIDQSFALLESKSTKIRKKISMDVKLEEISVIATSNRKSMGIAENSKSKVNVPVIKSTKTSLDNFTNGGGRPVRTRKSKYSITVENQKNINSNTEVPEDASTAKGRKLSEIYEDTASKGRKPKETIKTESSSTKTRKSKLSSVSKGDKEPSVVEAKKSTGDSSDEDFSVNNTKQRNRPRKRNVIESSEEGSSECPTPIKTTRKSRKVNSGTSDESGLEISKSSDCSTPKTKRGVGKNDVLSSVGSSGERSKRKHKPKIVFTMLDSPKLESYIKHLGGSIVDSVDSATVLMTESVKRSQKLLTAVAQGKPICPPAWINESFKKGEFLDPWDYVLTDKEAEKKWSFSLKESLERAERNKLFAGYSFQLMTNAATDVLKGAIEASGGKCVTKMVNKNQADKFVIVATVEHKAKYGKIKKQCPEVMVVEPEAIFDGVLRQEIRFSKHVLS